MARLLRALALYASATVAITFLSRESVWLSAVLFALLVVAMFVDRCPISEACRGVVTTLSQLGLDPNEKTLEPYRRWFAHPSPG